jgi:heme-degrading monooxygenase HmoA
MISRHWTGVAKAAHADDYVTHLRTETFPALQTITGFRGASILRRNVEDGVEFRIVTVWESLAAIEAFAGPEITRAVVPPAAARLMLRYDPAVEHYEVVEVQA